ncbi:hypothetical protein HNP84_004010 [Thermocatellispora tengchongensis]|uniref:GmrSD restriction endonucleases C-terminal domain-containing protein n=1 Tax=Thermocatellispora tengchongensis TaxID=1073253 RepID=A0A840P3L9_9ACTN|nr:HNH endonuclease family protein [Thermocatellispora tengchongensis]MBB5134278.1 hypothetical protein [Thermocatellispora tengchongensis]
MTVLAAAVIMVSMAAAHEGAPVRAVPLRNPEGTLPGLAPMTEPADRGAGAALIGRLRTGERGSLRGYSRERYGENWTDAATNIPFARNGCRTRDDMLARDGERVVYGTRSPCGVAAMTLTDPYTGEAIEWRRSDADRVQVDHVVPLAYGWRMGAARWPLAKRTRFANDPLNLLPVRREVNQAKGGRGPAQWLPPLRRARCSYAVRFAQVAAKYRLPVTKADKKVMLAQCR